MNPYEVIKMKDDQAKMRALNENGWCHGHLVIIDRYFLNFIFWGGGESTYWGVDKNEPKDHLQSKAVLFLLHSIVLV